MSLKETELEGFIGSVNGGFLMMSTTLSISFWGKEATTW